MIPKDTLKRINAARSLNRGMRRLFNDLAIYPRRSCLDFSLTGLCQRALNLQHAIILLARQGMGAEASALARLLCELWLVFRWITNQDREQTAERHLKFEAKTIDWLCSILSKHDSALSIPRHPQHKEMADAAAKYTSHVRWAGKDVKKMAEEPDTLEFLNSGQAADGTWDYDLQYFVRSSYTHSTAFGVRELVPYVGEQIVWSSREDHSLCDDAVVLSMRHVVLLFRRIDQIWCLGASAQIERLWTKCSASF